MNRLWTLLLLVVAAGGCAGNLPSVPQSPAELERHLKEHPQEYTLRTIALHNVRRVLANDLPTPARLDSLRVVEQSDPAGEATNDSLSAALADPACPPEVKLAVQACLQRRGQAALIEPSALVSQPGSPDVRTAMLEWLRKHPTVSSLDQVVRLWAADQNLSEVDEARYRATAAHVADGKDWREALVAALNDEKFQSRGSAMEVLARRVAAKDLRSQIAGQSASSETVKMLQYFNRRFGAMPATREEVMNATVAFRAGTTKLDLAAKMASNWSADDGYTFAFRDLHLLVSLASDPLRKTLSRAGLIEAVKDELTQRGVAQGGKTGVMRMGRRVDFAGQAEGLTTAELWNVYLLLEMCNRPRVRAAIGLMAQQDRADEQTRWGGLVAYEEGQAEARLYNPGERKSDKQYIPSDGLFIDAGQALAMFVGHFTRDQGDASNSGPDEDELLIAKEHSLAGLVLTSLTNRRFNATFLTAGGKVIDLGEFPLGR